MFKYFFCICGSNKWNSDSDSEDNCDNANLKVSVLLLFTVCNGSRFQIGMVRGMKLFLYGSFLYINFVCNLFHGGFCYFFSRGLRRVAGGSQCGHL